MLFIHPMFDRQSERVGKRKCTRIGYALHVVADLVGMLGLVLVHIVVGVWAWKCLRGTFTAQALSLAAIPLGLGVMSEVLYHGSCWLAARRGFRYDEDRRGRAGWRTERA